MKNGCAEERYLNNFDVQFLRNIHFMRVQVNEDMAILKYFLKYHSFSEVNRNYFLDVFCFFSLDFLMTHRSLVYVGRYLYLQCDC